MKKEYEDRVEYTNELGQYHKEDGPAIEWTDGKSWWIGGRRHREDGPARETVNGDKEWWLDDKHYGDKKPRNWKKLVLRYRAEKLLEV